MTENNYSKPMLNGRPVEIERKYLITPPNDSIIEILKNCEGYSSSAIEQIYITDKNGQYGRIRKRQFDDICRYYYTIKQNINGLSRFETEFEITEQEYDQMSKLVRQGTAPVKKVRICFLYEAQLFELDLYEFDRAFATLEIELQSEDQSVSLPDFINVIKDVTGDPEYLNFAISQRISR